MPVRVAMVRTLTMVILAVLVGVVCALVWANLAVLPAYMVQADGHALISDKDLSQAFSANFWFAVLGLLGGIAIGVATWILLRMVGWSVALLTAGLSLLSGVTCWGLGALLGPGPFAARMAKATAGDSVPMALELTTPSALAIWVFAAAAVPLFAASLGPEMDPGPDAGPRRGSRRRAEVDHGPEPVGVAEL